MPHTASKEEQIRVAENVLNTQGSRAWPVCGQRLRSGDSAPQAKPPVQAPKAVPATPADTNQTALEAAKNTLGSVAKQNGFDQQYQQLLKQNGPLLDSFVK